MTACVLLFVALRPLSAFAASPLAFSVSLCNRSITSIISSASSEFSSLVSSPSLSGFPGGSSSASLSPAPCSMHSGSSQKSDPFDSHSHFAFAFWSVSYSSC